MGWVFLEKTSSQGFYFAIRLNLQGDGMNKIAILIDGGFYLKCLPRIRPDVDANSAEHIVTSIRELVREHLKKVAKLQHRTFYAPQKRNREFVLEPNWYAQHYRTLYYDAFPFKMDTKRPISGTSIHYSSSSVYQTKNEFFDLLKRERNLALRLGQTQGNTTFPWQLRTRALQEILDNRKDISDLTDADFTTTIRQKGVDMRMGLDMASIALKKQANIFVLVTGDADFVPAAKLVRREGCQLILDPMWQSVSPDLYEHIDGLDSAFHKPRQGTAL